MVTTQQKPTELKTLTFLRVIKKSHKTKFKTVEKQLENFSKKH